MGVEPSKRITNPSKSFINMQKKEENKKKKNTNPLGRWDGLVKLFSPIGNNATHHHPQALLLRPILQ